MVVTHYLVRAALTVVVLVVVLLICRWVFSTGDRDRRAARRAVAAAERGDFGLLVPVAQVRTDADADLLREVLGAAGIRCTVTDAGEPGRLVVLVFGDDAARARSLVRSA